MIKSTSAMVSKVLRVGLIILGYAWLGSPTRALGQDTTSTNQISTNADWLAQHPWPPPGSILLTNPPSGPVIVDGVTNFSILPVSDRPPIELKIHAGGATARVPQGGTHSVTYDGNLNHTESLVVDLPENQKLKIHVVAIGIRDSQNPTVFLGQLKDCSGEIPDPNGRDVIYRDAFAGKAIQADVVYRYGWTYLEQFVVLRSQLPLPEGFDRQSARLEVWSEVFEAPKANVTTRPLNLRSSSLLASGVGEVQVQDDTVDFGWMRLAEGRAFAAVGLTGELVDATRPAAPGDPGASPGLDASAVATRPNSLPVSKTWFRSTDGRLFLIESADYLSLEPLLEKLPRLAAAEDLKPGPNPPIEHARLLPQARRAKPRLDRCGWQLVIPAVPLLRMAMSRSPWPRPAWYWISSSLTGL